MDKTIDIVKKSLNRSVSSIDNSILDRLGEARHIALITKKKHSVVLTTGSYSFDDLTPILRNIVGISVFLLMMLSINIFYQENIADNDNSSIDISILTDDLPIDALLFN